MTCFVFLGPSLPLDEARAILDAEFLPPVAMGDLFALVHGRARPGDRIAIIDGLFEQSPAVWHKEVLFAIELGITVYGASSMGALRAAELHPFGMRGVGRIFAAYRDGVIEDDDEVAVAHATAESGFRALSHAMVSLRFGLEELAAEGALTPEEAARLTAYAKAQPYAARSWAALVGEARRTDIGERGVARLRSMARSFDAKADDARALLRLLAEPAEETPAGDPGFVLERTAFWEDMVRARKAHQAREADGAPALAAAEEEEMLIQTRAHHPDRDALLARAALLRLGVEHTRDWTPTPADLTAAAFRLLDRHGLGAPDAVRAWRAAQGLADPASWRDQLELEARADLLALEAAKGGPRFLLAALKGAGVFEEAMARAAVIRATFGDNRTKTLSLEDAGVSPEMLQRWYERRCGRMLPDPEAHAARLGFETLRDFIGELLPTYLAEQAETEAAGMLAMTG